jgi:hypothetical protein
MPADISGKLQANNLQPGATSAPGFIAAQLAIL